MLERNHYLRPFRESDIYLVVSYNKNAILNISKLADVSEHNSDQNI